MGKTRILIACLAVVLLADAAFAGGSTEKKAAPAGVATPDGALVASKGTFPIVKEKVTLTLFSEGGAEAATRGAMAAYEAKTGVHVEFVAIPRSSTAEKLKMKMATKDLDDITRIHGMDNLTNAYAEEGYWYPIGDLAARYGENTNLWMKARPEVFQYITASDGKIYGWPWTTAESVLDQYRHYLWINQTWLARLNLKAPTTIDELYAVLKAFKEKDANGNGDPNDEIPFSTCTSRALSDFRSPLFTPYFQAQEWLGVSDGKVYAVPVQEAAALKEAVAFQRKLFSEGLMYKESLTQDRGTQWKVNEQSADFLKIGCVIGQHQNYAVNFDSPRWYEYTALPPLKGPKGVQYSAWSTPTGRLQTVIKADSKYPAVAFRWMDWLLGEEGSLFTYYGLEGRNWRKAEPGEMDVLGRQAKWTTLQSTDKQKFYLDNFTLSVWGGVGGVDQYFSFGKTTDPLVVSKSGEYKDGIRWVAAAEHAKYQPPRDQTWPYPPVDPKASDEMGILKTAVNDVITQHVAQFVAGQKDLARDWDGFQAELKKAGIERYLKLCQDSYDAYMKKAGK